MNNFKRIVYYLLINVFVSACTVVTVLVLWEQFRPLTGPMAMDLAPSNTQAVSGDYDSETSTGAPLGILLPSPTLLATSAPVVNIVEYLVKPNDTLGEIARQYNVDVNELIELNSLDDPNSLSAGIILYIPVPPKPTPTVDKLATATPSPKQISTPSGPLQEPRVEINSVIGAGDLATERVFLVRTGDGPLSLAGWKMEDEDRNTFVFPQLEFYEGGAVNVWTTSGVTTVLDLYWELNSPVWNTGEKVTLIDDQGKVHTTYIVP
jgi:LysM repeat protein